MSVGLGVGKQLLPPVVFAFGLCVFASRALLLEGLLVGNDRHIEIEVGFVAEAVEGCVPVYDGLTIPVVPIAIVLDGVHGAGVDALLYGSDFLPRLGLFVDVVVTVAVVSPDIVRRILSAEVAVCALIINVKLPRCVEWISVGEVHFLRGLQYLSENRLTCRSAVM